MNSTLPINATSEANSLTRENEILLGLYRTIQRVILIVLDLVEIILDDHEKTKLAQQKVSRNIDSLLFDTQAILYIVLFLSVLFCGCCAYKVIMLEDRLRRHTVKPRFSP